MQQQKRTDTIYANPLCGRRELERVHQMHRDRIRNVKTSIDTRPPRSMPHLTLYGRDYHAKKRATTEAAFSDLKMIQAIARTMTRPFEIGGRAAGPTSLNSGARKQEIFRIMSDNHQLLNRLENLKPALATKDLVREHRTRERYMVNASHTTRRIGLYDEDIHRFRKEDKEHSDQIQRRLKPLLERQATEQNWEMSQSMGQSMGRSSSTPALQQARGPAGSGLRPSRTRAQPSPSRWAAATQPTMSMDAEGGRQPRTPATASEPQPGAVSGPPANQVSEPLAASDGLARRTLVTFATDTTPPMSSAPSPDDAQPRENSLPHSPEDLQPLSACSEGGQAPGVMGDSRDSLPGAAEPMAAEALLIPEADGAAGDGAAQAAQPALPDEPAETALDATSTASEGAAAVGQRVTQESAKPEADGPTETAAAAASEDVATPPETAATPSNGVRGEAEVVAAEDPCELAKAPAPLVGIAGTPEKAVTALGIPGAASSVEDPGDVTYDEDFEESYDLGTSQQATAPIGMGQSGSGGSRFDEDDSVQPGLSASASELQTARSDNESQKADPAASSKACPMPAAAESAEAVVPSAAAKKPDEPAKEAPSGEPSGLDTEAPSADLGATLMTDPPTDADEYDDDFQEEDEDLSMSRALDVTGSLGDTAG